MVPIRPVGPAAVALLLLSGCLAGAPSEEDPETLPDWISPACDFEQPDGTSDLCGDHTGISRRVDAIGETWTCIRQYDGIMNLYHDRWNGKTGVELTFDEPGDQWLILIIQASPALEDDFVFDTHLFVMKTDAGTDHFELDVELEGDIRTEVIVRNLSLVDEQGGAVPFRDHWSVYQRQPEPMDPTPPQALPWLVLEVTDGGDPLFVQPMTSMTWMDSEDPMYAPTDRLFPKDDQELHFRTSTLESFGDGGWERADETHQSCRPF